MENEVQDDVRRATLKARLADILDRVEFVYLKLLRAAVLIIATGLIVYALVLAAVSLYRISRSPESVREELASVSANELTDAELPTAQQARSQRGTNTSPQRSAYDQILTQYYQLFRARFETFRQRDDRQLTRVEFDTRFLDTSARLAAIRGGDLDFQADVADLRLLLETMTEAAGLPATRQRLQRYRTARKVQVCRNVERTRTTYSPGWNPYATNCPNWYENMGCAVSRPVQVPYTARECSMQFPEGTQSHIQIFRAFQDRFFSLLTERRAANATRAETAREEIVLGIAKGRLNLWTALLVATGFIVLMFFFLLIAIERHQRGLVKQDAQQP